MLDFLNIFIVSVILIFNLYYKIITKYFLITIVILFVSNIFCAPFLESYIHTYARPMDFWSLFVLWGPQYPVFCSTSDFKILKAFLPSRIDKMKLTFFISKTEALKVSRTREAIAILTHYIF